MATLSLADIRATREKIDPHIVQTPVWQWQNRTIEAIVGKETEVHLKLELFQKTGTFKPRGALSNILNLEAAALRRGVTGVSAGNHAIALSYAASTVGTTAKVVMPQNANPARVDLCRDYGGEVILVNDVHEAFAEVERIEQEEGRTFVHPFEGERTTLGTATVGLEWSQQVPEMNAVIVSIGGGGLMAGIAAAMKQLQPHCQVIGVEPEGADTMHRSFATGKPEAIEAVHTIADSLGAPYAAPFSLALCQNYVDELVLVNDSQLRAAMRLLYEGMKLVVEPAGAAATAALCGPLREKLHGQRVGVIICGSNIDSTTFHTYLTDNQT